MKAYLYVLLVLLVASCAPSRVQRSYPVESPIAYQEPVKRYSKGLIVIDPGHGGDDLGTKSLTAPIVPEKHMNLTTARYLSEALEKKGYRTLLTRYDDLFIPLKDRAQFANERRPLLFVSVHFNAATSKEAKGIEVFYYKSDDKLSRTDASKKLAASILGVLVDRTKAPSRGVKHGNYAVIRETTMPAVLVEGGFLTNDEELERLKNPRYLKLIADSIAEGIDRYQLML